MEYSNPLWVGVGFHTDAGLWPVWKPATTLRSDLSD